LISVASILIPVSSIIIITAIAITGLTYRVKTKRFLLTLKELLICLGLSSIVFWAVEIEKGIKRKIKNKGA
jgi:hypothetical protein